MRVLLAIDGSAPSDRARDLVAGLPWPEGVEIRVVSALDAGPDLMGVPWMEVAPAADTTVEQAFVRQLTDALQTAVRDLHRPGRRVDHVLLRGRPASAVVAEARAWNPDLIVVGHRGRGTLASMILGSTSAEIVDHAPCPVLVARGPMVRAALLAEDGSEGAKVAAELLARWPVFRAVPTTVLSVAEVAVPMSVGVAAGLYDRILTSYTESVDEARREFTAIATTTAEHLTRAGLTATVDVRDGEAAAAIVEAASDHGVDLIVMGTRGHTGLARLILGGTARSVLIHAPCSVLIVREHSVTFADQPQEVGPDVGPSR